jgi:tRNA-specific 2-thiouridylase
MADADGVFVEPAEPEHGIAAGQACVLYANGGGTARVLGGGFIGKASD